MYNMLMQDSFHFRTLNLNLLDKINLSEGNISFNEIEKIIRKVLNGQKLLGHHQENLTYIKSFYLYELSTLFHAYWSKGNEDKSYKFIENKKLKGRNFINN